MEKKFIIESNGNEVIVREGKAADPVIPQVISITGTIDAPGNYWSVNKAEIDVKKAIVTFSYENQYIKLQTDAASIFGHEITGKLIKNPALEAFHINAQKKFNATDLVSFLRMNRTYFTTKDACNTLVAKLANVKADVQTKIGQAKDLRGNESNSAKVVVDSNVPMDFTLDMPIFKGSKSSKFKVEICLEVRDQDMSLWLESVELQEIIVEARKTAIDTETSKFIGFVKIEAQA